MRNPLISLLLLLSALMYVNAQPVADLQLLRPAASAVTLSVGNSGIVDTYLSPLTYSGWNISLAYERMQAMKFAPDNWVSRFDISVDASHGSNYVGNGSIWRGSLGASWSMMRRWNLPSRFTVGVGPAALISAGAIYNPRNGNNPAAAKAAVAVGATAYATRMFRIQGTRVLARLNTTTPLLGAFFSQQYGELYYEIWLGNRSGLVHCAWPGDYRQFDTTLTADIEIGSSWLRIGYRNFFHSSRVCDITTRVISNSFIIGISGEWLSLRKASRISPSTRIISALY